MVSTGTKELHATSSHRMGLPESRRAALGHAEVREVAFVFERGQSGEGRLEVVRHARALEQVHLLDSTEDRVDRGDATPEILRPARDVSTRPGSSSRLSDARAIRDDGTFLETALDREEGFLGIFRVFGVEAREELEVGGRAVRRIELAWKCDVSKDLFDM